MKYVKTAWFFEEVDIPKILNNYRVPKLCLQYAFSYKLQSLFIKPIADYATSGKNYMQVSLKPFNTVFLKILFYSSKQELKSSYGHII